LPEIVPPEMLSTSALVESLMAPEIKPPVWSIVIGLVAVLASIAAVVPMIVPELTIAEPGAKETLLPITMPFLALIVPEFDMFPEKALIPPTKMPSLPTFIVPALLIPPEKLPMPSAKMPWPAAEIAPELEIPPKKFVLKRATIPLPFALEMMPLLEMPPEKLVMATTLIPLNAVKILPLLLMPPVKIPLPPAEMPPSLVEIVPLLEMPPRNVVTPLRPMPSPTDEMVPPLVMPPVKTDTEATLMPMEPAEMVPLLEMPPRKLVTEPTAMPVPKKAAGAEIVPVFMILPANVEIVDRLMPGSPAEEIVPALDMLPVKVEPLIAMAVAVAAILLALSREMPPAIVPVSLNRPGDRAIAQRDTEGADRPLIRYRAGEAGIGDAEAGDSRADWIVRAGIDLDASGPCRRHADAEQQRDQSTRPQQAAPTIVQPHAPSHAEIACATQHNHRRLFQGP
jgi:hypothetical protein